MAYTIRLISIMDIQEYTPSQGRKLKILPGFILGYSLILLGLGIFIPVRYKFYSGSDYPECQLGNLKTIIYIIGVENLFIGLILLCISSIQLAAIRDWSIGHITSRDYWQDFHSEYNTLLRLILFILQLSVIGFISSNVFRVFDPSGCDPYLYYVLVGNVYIFYNLIFVGLTLYLACYLIGSFAVVLYKILKLILEGLCCDNAVRLMGSFGLSNRGRISRRVIITTESDNHTEPNFRDSIAIEVNTNKQNNIPQVISELIEFGTPDDCAVCIEPQKTGVKFGNCPHWVCEVCWSQIMNTNPVCPLCRAKIV